MAQIGSLVLGLAGFSDSEPLGCTPVGLNLRHLPDPAAPPPSHDVGRARQLSRVCPTQALARGQQNRHVPSFHPGRPIRLGDITDLLDDSVDQGPTQLGMRNLPAPKRNGELNTLAVANKAPDMLYLEIDIMLVSQRAHLNFLDGAGRRAALGVMRFLLLRIAVFVEISDPAHRRLCGRRDLDQVEPARLGQPDRVAELQDTGLFAVGVDYPDFG